MNPVHLIWIIPLALILDGVWGYFFAIVLMLAELEDDEKEYSGLLEED